MMAVVILSTISIVFHDGSSNNEYNIYSVHDGRCYGLLIVMFINHKLVSTHYYSMAKYCIQLTQRLLQQKAKNVDALDHVISKHQEEIKKQLETSLLSRSSVANSNQQHHTTIEVTSDSNDDDDMLPAPPTRGRGRWVATILYI